MLEIINSIREKPIEEKLKICSDKLKEMNYYLINSYYNKMINECYNSLDDKTAIINTITKTI